MKYAYLETNHTPHLSFTHWSRRN